MIALRYVKATYYSAYICILTPLCGLDPWLIYLYVTTRSKSPWIGSVSWLSWSEATGMTWLSSMCFLPFCREFWTCFHSDRRGIIMGTSLSSKCVASLCLCLFSWPPIGQWSEQPSWFLCSWRVSLGPRGFLKCVIFSAKIRTTGYLSGHVTRFRIRMRDTAKLSHKGYGFEGKRIGAINVVILLLMGYMFFKSLPNPLLDQINARYLHSSS